MHFNWNGYYGKVTKNEPKALPPKFTNDAEYVGYRQPDFWRSPLFVRDRALTSMEGLGCADPGLGQMKEAVESLLDLATTEAQKLGAEIAKPVVGEAEVQWKKYLPWLFIGIIGMTALGGFWGQTFFKARGRKR